MKYFEFNEHDYYALIGANDLQSAKVEYELHICELQEYDKDPEEISREQAQALRDIVCRNCGVPSDFEKEEVNAIEVNESWLVLIDANLI